MIEDIEYFCESFYMSTFYPVSYLRYPDEIVCSFPPFLTRDAYRSASLKSKIKFSKSPDYYLTDSGAYFGFVNIDSSETTHDFLVLGPLFSTPCTEKDLDSLLREAHIPGKYTQEYAQVIRNIPSVTFTQFLSVLAFLHYMINGKTIDRLEHFCAGMDTVLQAGISTDYSETMYEKRESEEYHNTYNYELRLLSYVRQGDPEGLTRLVLNQDSEIGKLHTGSMANNLIRSKRNQAIAITVLALRAAIEGGLDEEQAYQLGDLYIKEIENTHTPESIDSLSFTMMQDFASRVSKIMLPISGMSSDVYKALQYITSHINQPVRVTDVAQKVGKSRSYLSSVFKAELGFDMSEYIMRCKLEEAKNLLTNTDKPISEISSYLCFSSQAYFQNRFKKRYGITPLKYRKGNGMR